MTLLVVDKKRPWTTDQRDFCLID